jgi:hypothetical protein
VTFRRPNGTVLEAAPALPVDFGRLDTISAHILPVWDGTRFDLVYAMDVLYVPRGLRASRDQDPDQTT